MHSSQHSVFHRRLLASEFILHNITFLSQYFPCGQFIVDFANHCISGVLHPGSQHPGGIVHLFVLNNISSSKTCVDLVPCAKDCAAREAVGITESQFAPTRISDSFPGGEAGLIEWGGGVSGRV